MSNGKGGAVVTGAARGIGRELALGLLKDGFGVVIADVDPDAGSKTVDELAKEFGDKVIFTRTDVTKRAEVRLSENTPWQEVLTEFGSPAKNGD